MAKQYLMLPSSADFTKISLEGIRGGILTGTVSGAQLIGRRGATYNLTTLFGTMQPGVEYPLHVSYKNAETTIYLIKSSAVATMYITIDKDLSYIHQNKDNKAKGKIFMTDASNKIIVDTTLDSFKGRGNSTWNYSGNKKPYNIKMDEKYELIPGAGKSKSWCLLNNNLEGNDQHDRTGLFNIVAYEMFDKLGGDSALKSTTVDLYINNEYRGTYFLAEKVHFDKQRINVTEPKYDVEDEDHVTRVIQPGGIETVIANWNKLPEASDSVTVVELTRDSEDRAIEAGIQAYQYATGSILKKAGAYLTEIDISFWAEACWFMTRRGVIIVCKEPEFATKSQVQDIAIYMQEFEDAIYEPSGYNYRGKHYTEYMDIQSLAKRFALDCFIANADIFDGSSFHYVDPTKDNAILKAGPAWDYDASSPEGTALFHPYVGSGDTVKSYLKYRKVWAEQLMTRGDFIEEVRKVVLGTLKTEWAALNSSGIQTHINNLSNSQALNQILYKNNFTSYANKFKTNMANRYNAWYGTDGIWTDKNLLGVTIALNGKILTATISGTATALQWYKVNGNYTLTAINGATSTTYTPATSGTYVIGATGGNISYNPSVPSEYTTVDEPQMTMYSNPIKVA